MTQVMPTIEAKPDSAAAVCAACPHPLAAHDTISLRFCAATTTSHHVRGCVCPSAG